MGVGGASLPEHYREILIGLGEDPEREGLQDTPKRAAKAMQYLCHGYEQSLDTLVNGALFVEREGLLSQSDLRFIDDHHVERVMLRILAPLVRRMPGRFPTLLLISLSIIVSCRYLWWRYTSTLNWNDWLDLTCGLILLAAETYSWLILILGYIQTSWPLNRKPAQFRSAVLQPLRPGPLGRRRPAACAKPCRGG